MFSLTLVLLSLRTLSERNHSIPMPLAYILNFSLGRLSSHLATRLHSSCLSLYCSAPSHGTREAPYFFLHILQRPQKLWNGRPSFTQAQYTLILFCYYRRYSSQFSFSEISNQDASLKVGLQISQPGNFPVGE